MMLQRIFPSVSLFVLLLAFILSGCNGEKEEGNAASACPENIDFSASKTDIFAGESVDFSNNTSTGSADPADAASAADEESEGDEETEEDPDSENQQTQPFTWNFGDGSPAETGENRQLAHKFDKPGNYEVTLSYGPDCQKKISITVKARPEPEPCKEKSQVKIKASSLKIRKGESITFEELTSFGHQWEWSGGPKGGNLGSGKSLKISFNETGKYKVFCKVNNGQDPCILQPEGLVIEVRPGKPPVPPVPGGGGSGKPLPPPSCALVKEVPAIKQKLMKLFSDYKANPKFSGQFKSLSESMGFLVSDQVLKLGGSSMSMSDIRSELNNNEDFSVKGVADVMVDEKECRITRIVLK